MKLPYHSHVDDELEYAPCESMTKTENKTPVLRDYEITRESVEIIFHEDILSDSRLRTDIVSRICQRSCTVCKQ